MSAFTGDGDFVPRLPAHPLRADAMVDPSFGRLVARCGQAVQLQVTLTDSILDAGFQMDLWQKNHFEACYCLEGEGTVEELDNGIVHEIGPGTLYAMNNHDRHRIRAKTRMRVVCTFYPALTGDEVHDADGSL
jgi:L-ectoine synthase